MMKNWLKRNKWKLLVGVVLLLVLAEVILRWGIGLGERQLYTADPYCEYRFLPNQKVVRYGNLFETDRCGCRNQPIDTSNLVIAKFGDSVLSGGSHVDQDSTATSRLNVWLSEWNIQSTNCSAGSWGVENAYQFFIHRIDYKVDAIVLVFSAHDWHDNMHFKPVVGNHPAWPDHQPYLAITDVWSGYVWPKIKGWFGYGMYDYLKGFDDSGINPGWSDFLRYSEEQQLPFFVYVHPEIKELKQNKWSKNGEELIAWLKQKEVHFTTGLGDGNKEEFYIDNIHQNAQGHRFIYKQLKQLLSLHLSQLQNKY